MTRKRKDLEYGGPVWLCRHVRHSSLQLPLPYRPSLGWKIGLAGATVTAAELINYLSSNKSFIFLFKVIIDWSLSQEHAVCVYRTDVSCVWCVFQVPKDGMFL